MSITLHCVQPDEGVLRNVEGAPSINMGNSRGGAVLRLLGLDDNPIGWVRHHQLKVAIPACWQALNSPRKLQAECRAPLEISGAGGATMLLGGIDEDYLRGRLHDVLNLLQYAQKNGYDIGWV